jgi:A/G-specific adenine glycosylase
MGVSEEAFRGAVIRLQGEAPREFPWRETRDLYAVLIGEVLLQRTRGENAVPVYEEFLRRWPNPDALAEASEASIVSLIRPLGLAKRGPILKRLGRALKHLGEVPADPDALAALPGVGPYVSHAVPVFALDKNLPVVDWVIARVLRRYFDLPSDKRPNVDHDLWSIAARLAQTGEARQLWLGTLDLAASTCKVKPLCQTCSLRSTCSYAARSQSSG